MNALTLAPDGKAKKQDVYGIEKALAIDLSIV